MLNTKCLHFHKAIPFLILLAAILLLSALPKELGAIQESMPPQISAPSAILIDTSDGRVLWEKNSRERRPIASTTKIMTAILALENLKQDDLVSTSQRASDAGESELYLSPGEQRRVEELLHGLLLRSANDAAMVLAEKVGGSLEIFAKLMNEKAKSLGALDTNFTNPHGLKDGNHYSTAYDLALITRYALRNKKFAAIVRTRSYVLEWPGNPYPRVCENHNRLLNMYPWATGVKTGYTKEAGYCLVGSAQKDGLELIAVVLGAPSGDATFAETQAILEYGFANFERRKLVKKGKSFGSFSLPASQEKTRLISAADLVATVRKNYHLSALEERIIIRKGLSLPIAKRQILGKVRYRQGAWFLGEVNLRAEKGIAKPSLWRRMQIFISGLLQQGIRL